MATKTKIVKLYGGAKITVVSKKEDKFAYGFRRTGKNTVAVATAICVDEDKFSHKTARSLIAGRFDCDEVMNLRLPAEHYTNEEVENMVEHIMFHGNHGYYGK